MMDEALSEFLSETNEAFNVLEIAMYRDDGDGVDAGLLDYVCRFVYRVKGNCGFLDLPRLGVLADAFAEFMRQVSEDEADLSPQANDLMLRSLDSIKFILGALEGDGVEPEGNDKDLIKKLKQATAAHGRRRRRKSKTSSAKRPAKAAPPKLPAEPKVDAAIESMPKAGGLEPAVNGVAHSIAGVGGEDASSETGIDVKAAEPPGSSSRRGKAAPAAAKSPETPAERKTSRSRPAAKSAPKPKSASKPKPASKRKPASKPAAQPKAAAKPKTKRAAKAKGPAEPTSQAKSEERPKAKAARNTKPKAKAQPKAKGTRDAGPKSKTRPPSKAEPKSKPRPSAKTPSKRKRGGETRKSSAPATPKADAPIPVADIAARADAPDSDILDPTAILVMAPEIGALQAPALDDAEPAGADALAPAVQPVNRVGEIEARMPKGAMSGEFLDQPVVPAEDQSPVVTADVEPAAEAAEAADPTSQVKAAGGAKAKAAPKKATSAKSRKRGSKAASESRTKEAGKPTASRKTAKKSVADAASKPEEPATPAAKPSRAKTGRKPAAKVKRATAEEAAVLDPVAETAKQEAKPSRPRRTPAAKTAAKTAAAKRKRPKDADASKAPSADRRPSKPTEESVEPAAPEPAAPPAEETIVDTPAAAAPPALDEAASDADRAEVAAPVSETESGAAAAEALESTSEPVSAMPEPEKSEEKPRTARATKPRRPKRMIDPAESPAKPRRGPKRVPSRMVIVPEAPGAAQAAPEDAPDQEVAQSAEPASSPETSETREPAAEKPASPAPRARRPRRIVEPGTATGNGLPQRARGKTNGGAGKGAARPASKPRRIVDPGSDGRETAVPLAAEAESKPAEEQTAPSGKSRSDVEPGTRASGATAEAASAAVAARSAASSPMLEPVPVAPDPSSATVPRALVIFNPSAGWRRRRRFSRTLHHLQGMGFDLTVRETDGPGDAERLAAEAVRDGIYDLVIAAGGDGTINEIISGLAGSQIPLGIMPLGTANVLAHEVGLHAEPVEVATIISAGMARPMHLGRVDKSRHFALMAGVGFDARVVQKVGPLSKRLFGKLAFVWRVMAEMLRGRQQTYVVSVDGTRFTASSVIVANGRYYGGRYVCAPDARLTDPHLHVVLFERSGRWSILRYLLAARAGKLARRPDVRIVQATSVSIEGPAGDPVQADGEIVGTLPTKIGVSGLSLPLLQPE